MLWAVTSYFNPARYRRRIENYRVFREALGIPLLAVELSFNGVFELNADDADQVLHINGGDVLWQKERLLNLGLRQLPADCDTVAFLDCDILFGDPAWAGEVTALLQRAPMAQAFSQIHHLGRDAPANTRAEHITFTQPSIASAVARGSDPQLLLAGVTRRDATVVSPGYAWAFRREAIERHDLYEFCIAGGGDNALACAAWGCFEKVIGVHRMNPHQQARYLEWARPFHAEIRGTVASATGDIFHLWHGDMADRRPGLRHVEFQPFGFNPAEDIRAMPGEALRWNSAKPQLHAWLRDYFSARREDG